MTIRDRFFQSLQSAEERMDQKLTANIRREAYIAGKPYGRMLEISHEGDQFEALYPYEHSDIIIDDETSPYGESENPYFIRRFLNDIDEDDLDMEFDSFLEEDGLL